LSIDFESVDSAGKSSERAKGKETKRTDYTNRESVNSIKNYIEQPTSTSKIYASLLHSLSERHLPHPSKKI
jgi:hypothetical protein